MGRIRLENVWKPIAIALVVEREGTLVMVGSRQVERFTIEMRRETMFPTFVDGALRAGALTVDIEAQCGGAVMYQSGMVAPAAQLPSGLYLPGMRYQALLPGPEKEDPQG